MPPAHRHSASTKSAQQQQQQQEQQQKQTRRWAQMAQTAEKAVMQVQHVWHGVAVLTGCSHTGRVDLIQKARLGPTVGSVSSSIARDAQRTLWLTSGVHMRRLGRLGATVRSTPRPALDPPGLRSAVQEGRRPRHGRDAADRVRQLRCRGEAPAFAARDCAIGTPRYAYFKCGIGACELPLWAPREIFRLMAHCVRRLPANRSTVGGRVRCEPIRSCAAPQSVEVEGLPPQWVPWAKGTEESSATISRMRVGMQVSGQAPQLSASAAH